MTFDDFLEYCSFDEQQVDGRHREHPADDLTQIVCIFSVGFLKDYGTPFVRDHGDIAKRLVAHDLYDHLKELFNDCTDIV